MEHMLTLILIGVVAVLAPTVSSASLASFDLTGLQPTNLQVRGVSEAQCNSYTTLKPGDSANFKSPNYPGNYGSLNFCKWIFAGSTDEVKITINCDDFAMHESWSCLMNDNLSLWLGFLNKKWYCGSNGPENVTSNGNWVVAKFHSNLFNNDKGFSCTATASGSAATTAPPTTLPPGPTVTAVQTTTP
ncbi:unnamed protein product [Meganyctiphanes norvegica]|uniref:CUB domain-containing protein n=1 Tax=Meganyctiphanes norvegica TaxID=48144 RepID=A0AAV2Q1E6_MEGNR